MKLDFGCGDGGFDEISEDRLHLGSWVEANGGTDTMGIDIDQGKIHQARRNISNGTKFICCNGMSMPFADSYFDVVHECGVLHHIKDYQKALREIARVLKPGGILFLKESVDNDPIFRVCRRIAGDWQGDEVASKFTSDELDWELMHKFIIVQRFFYWRFTFSDLLREYHAEPRLSLYFNDLVSEFFAKMRIDKQTCSHYVVIALRKNEKQK